MHIAIKRAGTAALALTFAAGIAAATAQPASANNLHMFGSSSSSKCNMLVANNNTTATRSILYPGGGRYGDWLYVPTGKVAVNSVRTLGQGWHYDGGLASDSYRCDTK